MVKIPSIDDIAACGVNADDARVIAAACEALCKKHAGEALWTAFRTELLTPAHPFALHQLLANVAFAGWNEETQGPRPLWRASEARKAKTNIAAVLKEQKLADYDALYDWSIDQGRHFWAAMVSRLGIVFDNGYVPSPDSIVDTSNPKAASWFPGATLNIAKSCFLAPKDTIAVICQKEGDSELKHYSYGELDAMSNRVASALVKHGFKTQDRIAIDMPFTIESVVMFLGILKMGGVVVSLADSFKKMDIDIRLEAAKPVKAVFTQDVTGGLKSFPLYPTVIEAPLCPRAIVVATASSFKPLRDGDISYEEFLHGASDSFTPVAQDGEAPLNIIFSSSTSSPKEGGDEKPKPPKAIPWKPSTALKSAIDAHLHHDMQPGKVLCWPTNLGWMMGSFAIFGALINRGTLAMFDGNPASKAFVRFVEKAHVNILGLVPSVAETWQKNNTLAEANFSAIEIFSSTGSPSNKTNYFWLMGRVKGYVPCFEYMGGTEIGGGYLINSYFQPASPSCFTTPALGTELKIWERDDADARAGEVFIVMRNGKDECPPMGLSNTLLNFDHDEKYFTRGMKTEDGTLLREHGDLINILPGGFYASHGRADDGININGIKTSSLDLENYIKDARIPGVKEVAAIGVRPPAGGEDWLVVYATADAGITGEQLKAPVRNAIKQHNPQLARVHDVVVISTLPLTASGKLRRRYLQDLYIEQLPATAPKKAAN